MHQAAEQAAAQACSSRCQQAKPRSQRHSLAPCSCPKDWRLHARSSQVCRRPMPAQSGRYALTISQNRGSASGATSMPGCCHPKWLPALQQMCRQSANALLPAHHGALVTAHETVQSQLHLLLSCAHALNSSVPPDFANQRPQVLSNNTGRTMRAHTLPKCCALLFGTGESKQTLLHLRAGANGQPCA